MGKTSTDAGGGSGGASAGRIGTAKTPARAWYCYHLYPKSRSLHLYGPYATRRLARLAPLKRHEIFCLDIHKKAVVSCRKKSLPLELGRKIKNEFDPPHEGGGYKFDWKVREWR